jgi:hypothetical protein
MSPEERYQRSVSARRKFRALVKLIIANLSWLQEIEDEKLGENVKKNIQVLTRKKGKKSILTLKDKSVLNKPQELRTEAEKNHLRRIIGNLKCFRRYPSEVKNQLPGIMYFNYFGPNRVIVKQNYEPLNLYVILTGEVVVSQTYYDRLLQQEVTKDVLIMGPGNYFGEVGLLHDIARTATRHHHGSVGISLRETRRFRQSPERDGGQPVGRSADEHVLVHLLQKLEPSGHPRELHLGKKEELRSGPDHLEQLRGTTGLRVLRHQRQLLPHRTHDHQDLLQRGHPPLHPDHEPRRTGGATEPRRLQGHQKVAQEGRVPRRTAETDAATRYKHVETFSATFLHHAQRAHSLHQSVHFQQIGVLQRRREPEEQDHRLGRESGVFAPAAVFF